MGVSIRTQRGTRAAGERAYSVVDREGGRVLVSDVVGLAALERRLWMIARDRRRPTADVPTERCPGCGTPRVAFFRWCQTCGRDFEAGHLAVPLVDPGRRAKIATARTMPARHAASPVATFTLPTPVARADRPPPQWPTRTPDAPVVLTETAPPRRRLARLFDDVLDADWLDRRRLVLGALTGLAIGVIVTILLLALE